MLTTSSKQRQARHRCRAPLKAAPQRSNVRIYTRPSNSSLASQLLAFQYPAFKFSTIPDPGPAVHQAVWGRSTPRSGTRCRAGFPHEASHTLGGRPLLGLALVQHGADGGKPGGDGQHARQHQGQHRRVAQQLHNESADADDGGDAGHRQLRQPLVARRPPADDDSECAALSRSRDANAQRE